MITQRRMTSESKLKAITKKHKITGGKLQPKGNKKWFKTRNRNKTLLLKEKLKPPKRQKDV